MATADRMARNAASKRTAAARKARGMRRSTARSIGRTVSKTTSRAALTTAQRRAADASSGRSTTSPRTAEIQRSIVNATTRLPGQNQNSAANRNSRAAATKVVQSSRARVAAEKGGTQRSRSALARVNRRRTTKLARA